MHDSKSSTFAIRGPGQGPPGQQITPELPVHAPSVALRSQRQRWYIAAGLTAVITIALFFRLYQLDTFLHWAFGDELTYGIEAQKVRHGTYSSLFTYTWDQAAATYPYLVALFQQLFGESLHSGRLVSVVFGTLTVPLVALCARELDISWTNSLLASALVAVSHWHVHFSRMAVSTVVDAFFLLLAIYTLMLTYRRGQWWLFTVSGAACGLAPYWFIPNRILGILLIFWFAYLAVVQPSWVRQNWWKIAVFIVSCLVVVSPLAGFWIHDTDWFMGPEHHVGIVYNVSYWAGQHPGESTAAWNIVWHQLPLALGMFVVNGGPYTPWGGTFAPAMDVVTGWLLFPSIAFALLRWRNPLVALTLIWLFCIWIFGVVLTLDAPQMEHAVGAIPALFLLIALFLDACARLLARKARYTLLYPAIAAMLVLASGVLNYQAYFQTWEKQLAGKDGFSWQFYDAAIYVGRHDTPKGTAIYSWDYPGEFFHFLSPRAHDFLGDPKNFRPASLYIVIAGASIRPDQIASRVLGARQETVRDVDGDLAFTAILPPRQ